MLKKCLLLHSLTCLLLIHSSKVLLPSTCFNDIVASAISTRENFSKINVTVKKVHFRHFLYNVFRQGQNNEGICLVHGIIAKRTALKTIFGTWKMLPVLADDLSLMTII